MGIQVSGSAVAVRPARRHYRASVRAVSTELCLIVFAAIFSIPFFWLLTTSLKTYPQIIAYPIVWIPNPLILDHYVQAFKIVPFARYIGNTMVIALLTMVGAVLSNGLTAYSFSRINWPLAKPLFALFLATMMIPFPVLMIPQFLVFRTLGWLDTYLPLIAPSFFGHAFYIFLLRQFFLTIPLELSDAARIDGAGEFRILWYIIAPLAKPALATIALFQFISAWESFLGPLIYINSKELYTVSLGLAMFRGEHTAEIGPMMAGSAVMVLPIIVLFFLTQRTFIQGITLTGIKG
ncbi:MAG: carbohydrate ABC transporter permease [Chloroflexi bacterium]|nr:carbohydrate ABC transporter permease [Chloroflexota bacterium]